VITQLMALAPSTMPSDASELLKQQELLNEKSDREVASRSQAVPPSRAVRAAARA
jgi:hypothetical protein